MSKSAQSHQAAPARGIRRFIPASIKPVVVKLSRKLSVTYWQGRRRTVSATLMALLAGFVHSLAAASPGGERVVSGSAVVSRPNASTTLVTQGSQNAIINWQSFSIGAGEGVRFIQPSASAVALNRVVGNDPSRIFGSLSANGKVFLVNTAGVYFAPGASVDVGGLVASSMRINDANFLAGKYQFEGGANAGAVDNQGMLGGAFVVLAAPKVSNSGSIVATGGTAALAAGGRMSLDIAGDKLVSLNVDAAAANAAVVNSGSISADGGKVFMSAHSANALLDTVINTSGVVRANSIGMRNGQIVIDGGGAGTVAVSGTLAASGAQAGTKGGTVAVLGDKVGLQAGASVDVSGDAGGGAARIGGDFHGAGVLKTASSTQVDKGAQINADAVTSGNGGTVAVWSDQHTGFAGSISARGGAQGGDGGFVETSGKRTLAFSGAVTTKAAKGATGTLLLDPTDITITSAPTASASSAGGTFTGTADSSNIQDTDLETALGSSSVIVDATAGAGAGTGNITVGTPIAWSGSNSLTLKASNNINSVGAAISSTGGGAVYLYGDNAIATGAITTSGGAVEVKGTGGGTSMAGSFAGGAITSGGGNVILQSNGSVNTGAINSLTGTIAITGNGAVTIDGALSSTNAGNSAIVIKAGAQALAGSSSGGDISVGGGSISVTGTGRATLYTGSVSGSTGVAAAIGAGSGRFRYNSDESTHNYAAGLGSGVYAVYREQPTLTIAADAASMTYGGSVPVLTASLSGPQNGDTSGQALSTSYAVSASGATSSSGNLTAGAQSINASGAVDQLGYNIVYTPGTLTVAQKALAQTGLSAPASKTYDGNLTSAVTGTVALGGAVAGDDVASSGTPVGIYNSKDVSTANTVNFVGLGIGGADAGNYTLLPHAPAAATITPKALASAVSAPDKAYDGSTAASLVVTITGGLVGSETVNASGAGTFDSKDVASATQVSVNSVTLFDGAGGGLASNYSVAAGGTAPAHITPAVLTASVTAPDKIYDGTVAAAPTVTVIGGLVAGETVGASATGSFNSKNVIGANQVTVDTVALADGAGGGLASNYSLAAGGTATAHITPAPLSASVTAVDKAYDGTTAAVPTLAVTGGLVAGETVNVSATGSFNTKDVTTANQVTVDSVSLADGAGGGMGSNYSLASGGTATAHITPAALTVSVTGADKVYDGTSAAAPALTVTGGLAAGESLVVSGTGIFDTKDVATASQVTVTSASLADGAGGGLASNYSLAAGATGTAHITPRALTATVAAPDKVYDGNTTAAPTLTVTGGLVGAETVAASGTAHFDSKDVVTAGLVTVDTTALADGANGGLASNYSLAPGQTAVAHVTPKALVASAASADKIYDGTTAAPTSMAITGGLVGSETLAATATGSYNSKDVLTANQVTVDTVTLVDGSNGGLASNYSLAAAGTVTAHITPKPLSVSGLIATTSKVYDGSFDAAVAGTGALDAPEAAGSGSTADGRPYIGDAVAIGGTATGTYNSKDVAGATSIAFGGLALSGGAQSNYSLAFQAPVPAVITPRALGATASAPDKAYDGATTAAPTLTITSGLVGAETVGVSATGNFDFKDVANASLVTVGSATLADGANGGLASNYSLAAGQTALAHITPKALTATVAAPDKVYDGAVNATPTLTITSGLVGTETVGAVGTASFNSKDVATASLVTVDSTALADGANGGLASNYSLAAGQTVAAHVTPKALSADAAATDKVYDGTLTAAPTLAISAGLVGAETVVASAAGAFNSKDVADANLVTVGAVSLADGANGGLAGNYSLAGGQTAVAHITPKALTAAASTPNKVYDANVTAAPTLAITAGLIGTETVTTTATGAFNSKDVASAHHVTVDSVALQDGANGGLASNYSLAAGQTAAAHITPKALTASATAADKVYDGSTSATPTLVITGGLVGAETVTASGAAAFNTKDVLSANLVTVTGTTLADGSGLASNYSLAAGHTAVAHITPRALAATASAPNKVYDANVSAAPALAITAGLVGAETVTASATGSFNSKDVVGADHVTVATVALHDGANGGVASNYKLAAGETATAHVTPKALTASVAAPDKTYDGLTSAAPVLTITGGLVGPETVTATGAATFNTKDVPTANLVTVNSTALANGANGGLASNYSLAAGENVAAHITRKTLSMSGLSVPASKVYNANTIATVSGTATLQAAEAVGAGGTSDLKPYVGDTIAISGTPVGNYNSKDVASASQVSFSGMTLSGAQAGNYQLSIQPAAAATITRAHIGSVSSFLSTDKVYDGNTSAAINSSFVAFNGMMPGDGLSVTGGTANFSDRNVGAGKTVSIVGFSLAGANAPNYTLDNNTASAIAGITRRPSVTYIGASGGDWALAANWESGALPDRANVANVVIPAGKSVSFTSTVAPLNGSVQLDSIDGAGTLNVGSGTLNVAHALNIGGYGQSGGIVGAGSMAASSGFSQTGGTLAVTGALGIQQATGSVNLGDLSAATMAIGGGAGVRQADGSAVVVHDGVTLATGAGDAILGNANNDFSKVAIGSANNVTLKTRADGLAIGGATIGGDLVASTPGAVTQTGAITVQGATAIDSGSTLHLDAAANSLLGKVKLTSVADTSLAVTGGVAIGGDIGGALALTATGPVTQAGDALHVTGTTKVDAGSADIVLTHADNDFGAALSASGRNIAVADKTALAFGATTASGTLDATAGGAVTQSGKLAAGGRGSIIAAGQAVTLADSTNSFGGTLRLGAASATVNAASPLAVTSEVAGSLTLAAPQLTVSAANALNLHVATGGAATVNADKALSIDGNVSGALVAKAGGAVTQGAAALTVGGASDIQAAGQSVVLANPGNDFGGDLTLAAASAQLADKNALRFASAAVTGNLQASAKGDVTQKGGLNVGGTTGIDTTGAVTLDNAVNDFAGVVSASGSNVTLRDANLLTVGKITAPQADLTAGVGLQMTGSGIVDSPKISLALTQLAGSGSIGTAALPFKVKDSASVTLGALTPAVPAFFGGSGVQVSVTNGVALREYSRELVALYLGNSKPYNRVLDDFVSQNIVSLSKILRDAQKKADSSTDLIDNGMPIDLTEHVAYPHAGALKLKEPCKDRKDCK